MAPRLHWIVGHTVGVRELVVGFGNDKEEILRYTKLNDSRPQGGRKTQEEVNQVTTAGRSQQKIAQFPE